VLTPARRRGEKFATEVRSPWSRRLVALAGIAMIGAVSSCTPSQHAPVTSSGTSAPTTRTSTSTSNAPSLAAACVLDPQALAVAIRPWLGEGSITIDPSSDAGRCTYDLPADSFNGSSAQFVIDVHGYSDDQRVTTSTNGVSREYGGGTPQQVYASARTAFLDLSHAGAASDGFADYPEIGAGLVTDGVSQLILAGTHDRWYTGGPTNTALSPKFNAALVSVARALLPY
jgi:hypothetical protein